MELLYSLSRFVYDASPDVSTLLLFMLLGLGAYIILQAQKPGNYWADAFADDAGKRSIMRVGTLGALAVSSAILLYFSVNNVKSQGDLDAMFNYFVAYCAFWSGAPVVSKALDLLIMKFGGKVG